eukprot:tig00000282_g23838.t1
MAIEPSFSQATLHLSVFIDLIREFAALLFEAWRLASRLTSAHSGAARIVPYPGRGGAGGGGGQGEGEGEGEGEEGGEDEGPAEDDETVAAHCAVLVAWCASKRVLGRARNETYRTAIGAAMRAAQLVAARRCEVRWKTRKL